MSTDNTESSTGVSSEEKWPFDREMERAMIFLRFYGRDELQAVGERLDLEWFADNRVGYGTEWDAALELASAVETPDALEEVLNYDGLSVDPRPIQGFYGWHYVAEPDQQTDAEAVTVEAGPADDRWDEVVSDVRQQAAGNETLIAFLRGLTDQEFASVESDRLRAKFSDTQARGSQYVDDGQLYASHVATEPGAIFGVGTGKTQSGRWYSVAQELVPVIAAACEELVAESNEPVETPEQDVPDEIDRRIPKFDEVLGEVEVTDEDVAEFESILAEHDALEYWAEYVAPQVKHRPIAKRAVLCMLASPDDAHGTKGRTNAIMYGPPGTGKTAFKNFLVEEFGAYSIDGARVSKADLTYNKSTGEDGLLVRAHKGLAVVEEADELDGEALGAALTAFGESGQLEIRDMRLPAEVRGILLGNYRSRAEIIEMHSEALFNRFEFVVEFDRLDESERNAAIDWQYDHFRQPKNPADTDQLKKYIAWVREFEPEISEATLNQIKEYKSDRIAEFENVREGISVLTVAYTIARLNHRDVQLADYETAFRLVSASQ